MPVYLFRFDDVFNQLEIIKRSHVVEADSQIVAIQLFADEIKHETIDPDLGVTISLITTNSIIRDHAEGRDG